MKKYLDKSWQYFTKPESCLRSSSGLGPGAHCSLQITLLFYLQGLDIMYSGINGGSDVEVLLGTVIGGQQNGQFIQWQGV